jgi:hypothetical protein
MSTALVFGANRCVISPSPFSETLFPRFTEADSQQCFRHHRPPSTSRRPLLLEHDDPRITFKPIDLLQEMDQLRKQLEDAGAAEATHVLFNAFVSKEGPKRSLLYAKG